MKMSRVAGAASLAIAVAAALAPAVIPAIALSLRERESWAPGCLW